MNPTPPPVVPDTTFANAPSMWIMVPVAALAVGLLFYFLYWISNPRPRRVVDVDPVYEDDQLFIEEVKSCYVVHQPYHERLIQPAFDLRSVVVHKPRLVDRPPAFINSSALDDMDLMGKRVLDQLLSTPIDQPINEDVLAIDPIKPDQPKVYTFSVGTQDGVDRQHKLDHARFIRRTGGGKSVILARAIPQLIAQGVDVWYINPKYMPVDKTGLDIQPIIDRCARIAVGSDGRDGFRLLMEAKMLPRQRVTEAQRARSQSAEPPVFKPVVVVVEELQTLMELWEDLDVNDTPGYKRAAKRGSSAIKVILATGRQPEVFYWTTSQDAQVQNGGTNTGAGNNYGVSVMHPSLDSTSLQNITGGAFRDTDFPKASSPYQWYTFEKTNGLGKGELHMVDVPLPTNEWIATMLKDVPVVERHAMERRKQDHQGQNDSPVNQFPANVARELLQKHMEQPVPPVPPIPSGTVVPFGQTLELGVPPSVPAPIEVVTDRTRDLVRAAAYMADCPNPTQRELAEHLWGKSDGRYNGRAGKIIDDVRTLMKEQRDGTTSQAVGKSATKTALTKGARTEDPEVSEPVDCLA